MDTQGNYVSMAAAQAGMVMPPHSNPGLATMAMAEAVAAAQHGMASMHGGPYPNHAMAHHGRNGGSNADCPITSN